MEKLFIDQTKSTPQIDFDPETNELRLKGQSYPENAFKFYEPVLKWVDEYLTLAEGEIQIDLEFEMPYINTSSAKCIMMLLDRFETAHSRGKTISINWYYDDDNESSLECAEEFREDVSLPFNIIPVK
jgi:hypothetical protein